MNILEIQNRKYTNEITAANAGERVSVAGWVHDTTKHLNEATSMDVDKRDVFRTTVCSKIIAGLM